MKPPAPGQIRKAEQEMAYLEGNLLPVALGEGGFQPLETILGLPPGGLGRRGSAPGGPLFQSVCPHEGRQVHRDTFQ